MNHSNEGIIKMILDSYGFSEAKDKRVYQMALSNVTNKGLSGFEAYKYVSNMVESINERDEVPYQERVAQRLRDPYFLNPSLLLEEVVPSPEVPQKLSIEELYQIVQEHLDPGCLDMLRQLTGGNLGDIMLHLSPHEVVDKLPMIKNRLVELRRKFDVDGKLLLPRRPIVQIDFDQGLSVKLGYRNYNGDPLSLFRANIHLYRGMGRKQLRRFDRGMYNALVRWGQIDQAIPLPSNYQKPVRFKIRNVKTSKPKKILISLEERVDEELIIHNNGFILRSRVIS